MAAIRKSIPLILALALLGSAAEAHAEARRAGLAGRVLGGKAPLASAGVYAYQLADLTLHKASTDPQGNFFFHRLPAGLYKVIAHKAGFLPVVVPLTRTTAMAFQEVEVQLVERPVGQEKGDDFWSLRKRIPADVLREIEREEIQLATFAPSAGGSLTSDFHTEMQAMTGVDAIASEEVQVSGAGVGIEGKVGQTEVELRGRIFQLNGVGFRPGSGPVSGGGQTSSLSLGLERGTGSRIHVTSLNNRMTPRSESGDSAVDFEHYGVSWTQEVGESGRSDFAAHYTAENNFHRQGPIEPLDIPETSQTWRIEGAYTTALGDSGTLQAGLRYRERQFGLSGADQRPGQTYEKPALASIDLFSRGGVRLQPAFLVQYGLYSTLSDGSLSLMPQGGFVLRMGPDWQMEASASRRVYEDAPLRPDFITTLFEQDDLCEQGSESCYEVRFSRQTSDDNVFSFGAVHRTVGDTLRLYFSEDFFDRMQSLYLVRGDELPELRMSLSRRLSPKVVTKLESSLASGGGGMFFAPTGQPYENQIQYLITSLDTQFQSTSTGVFVAFHHLSQRLEPTGSGPTVAEMESERLRLMLSQNLDFLLDLASDWALQLNMELSRGANPDEVDDELRHRFLGGIAVKF
ncbi:MAG TPA: carboxypeptidase-like regulatory domain-containing protein [Thermoanaerobaculia bacterium]|nr:carboxypeptidase-like regulatory domain-containing protein [Thermoanaerobaculia bacterium]